MNHFIISLDVNGTGPLEFYFTRTAAGSGLDYLVSTIDRQLKSHLFHVLHRDGTWKLASFRQPYAAWIRELEPQLVKAIEEHLKQ
jgi:hypothetical protein